MIKLIIVAALLQSAIFCYVPNLIYLLSRLSKSEQVFFLSNLCDIVLQYEILVYLLPSKVYKCNKNLGNGNKIVLVRKVPFVKKCDANPFSLIPITTGYHFLVKIYSLVVVNI